MNQVSFYLRLPLIQTATLPSLNPFMNQVSFYVSHQISQATSEAIRS